MTESSNTLANVQSCLAMTIPIIFLARNRRPAIP